MRQIFPANLSPNVLTNNTTTNEQYMFIRLIAWLEFNGTFSTNQLYCAFDKHVAVKKSEINEKFDNVTCWEYIQ